jgi:ATP-binding cassette subfamily B protein
VARLFGLAWHYRLGCVAVLMWQIAVVVLELVVLALTGLGIDALRHSLDPMGQSPRWPFGIAPPADWSIMTTIAVIAVVILGSGLLLLGAKFVSAVTASRLVQQIVVDLRTQVYDKLQRLSFRFFEANNSSSLINRVAGDVQAVRRFVDGVTVQVLIVVLSLAVYLVYMLNIHVGLTLACLCTTPLLFVAAVRFSRSVKPRYVQNRHLMDHLVRQLVESVQGVSVIKGFAQERPQSERFRQANERVKNKKHEIFWRISLFQPSMGMLTQINLAVLLGYGGYLILTSQLPLGVGLFVFAGLLQRFSSQVSQITNITNSIQTSLTGAERVFEVLDAPVEIESPCRAISLPKVQGAVQFEGVSFAYTPDESVLCDIDFSVKPGECVAIAGVTGSGKSTLLSLIPRFYDPTSGRVLIDDSDIGTLQLDDLRRNIGVVFQESFLFSNTAAANIAFGHPEASREQIKQAARLACADEFIVELPDGYDTVIGEHGSNLSGGQRQRLAIARALLLDPAILLMDDPTAAIDPQTEDEILAAMDSAMLGRTTFVITHRMSTLQRADLVVVLAHGQIVQIGSPAELLRLDGHFRTVVGLQMSDDDTINALAVG